MNSILGYPLRAVWRALAPLRRQDRDEIDARMDLLLRERLAAELDARLVPTLTAALQCTEKTMSRLDALIAHTDRTAAENEQVLNTLLGEVIRLREEIEVVQRLLPPDDSEPAGAFIEPDETCAPVSHEARDGWS